MRYFIQNAFKNEIRERRDFLYETFHIWTYECGINSGFILLQSMPSNILDVCFVVGHNRFVDYFLNRNNLYEKNIVAITCDKNYSFKKKNNSKKFYLPYQDKKGSAYLIKGSEFGFNFDLTESEISLYNSPKNLTLEERLDLCFTK
mgnify:CR=1 FL=1